MEVAGGGAPPIRRILVATDLSEASRRAVELAGWLAARVGAELVVLSVIDTSALEAQGVDIVPHMRLAELVAGMERALDPALAEFVRQSALPQQLRLRLCTRRGPAARTIVQGAAELGADLIVIGTHGRSGLSRLVFGSVAEKVLRLAPVPVLTVQPAPGSGARAGEQQASGAAEPACAPEDRD
ncbi:MAG: universal stress protein [Planctomycetota bacterium]|nr:MAG: universal stress protein [Planctomycetota bacterium]